MKRESKTMSMTKNYVMVGMSILAGLSLGVSAVNADTTTDGTVTLQAPTGGNGEDLNLATAQLPTNLNFGATNIKYDSSIEQIATVDGDQSSAPTTTDVQVTDNRGDLTKGWKLKVKQNAQFTSTVNQAELEGAELKITTGAATNIGGDVPTGGVINAQDYVITPGVDVEVFKSAAGEGLGISTLPINQYKLSIPGAAKKEADTYNAQLTWTFSDTL